MKTIGELITALSAVEADRPVYISHRTGYDNSIKSVIGQQNSLFICNFPLMDLDEPLTYTAQLTQIKEQALKVVTEYLKTNSDIDYNNRYYELRDGKLVLVGCHYTESAETLCAIADYINSLEK